MILKKCFLWLISISLLFGCQSVINTENNEDNQVKNCGLNSDYQPLIDVKSREDFFRLFDFYIQAIIKQSDRLIFQTKNHDLVFCQGDQSFSIQPSTRQSPPEKNYQQLLEELSNPPYENITLNEQNYQYRVLLEPNPFPNFQVEANQVIFELVTPNNPNPIRQVVYDLEQTKKAQAGITLGVPKIVTTKIFDKQIYWAISPEQGEGNGGIATIIKYDPNNNKLSLIQPQELNNQQINDFVITEENNNLTFWLAVQQSGEGNPYLASMGLVVFQPENNNYLQSYHVRNSPIIGAIPTKLEVDNQFLWLGTGNGICQVIRAKIADYHSWQCWQIKLLANLNQEKIDLFPSLLSEEKIGELSNESTQQNKQIEVLWWAGNQESGDEGRYEIKYDLGTNLKLAEGFSSWQEIYGDEYSKPSWKAPVYWVGNDWYWRNEKFQRGFDSVPLNAFGGGFSGITIPSENYTFPLNSASIRGDLDLINISQSSTEIKYYSAWVDSKLLTPYLTLIPAPKFDQTKPNPL